MSPGAHLCHGGGGSWAPGDLAPTCYTWALRDLAPTLKHISRCHPFFLSSPFFSSFPLQRGAVAGAPYGAVGSSRRRRPPPPPPSTREQGWAPGLLAPRYNGWAPCDLEPSSHPRPRVPATLDPTRHGAHLLYLGARRPGAQLWGIFVAMPTLAKAATPAPAKMQETPAREDDLS
nr:unnamed protein product [Digitaria exilis]